MKPTCSIVIRAYNEEKHIGRLLTGIFQQTVKDVQVVLVDSGSTDATVAIASKFPVEVFRIHPEEFTFGFSLNKGISHTRADKVVFASAHVYPVYPDWLEKLLQPFENPQTALSYGKQRGMETTKFSEHQVFSQWFPDHNVPRQDHPFCNNANAAIRRALWEEHPYDENIPALEDLAWADWAQRQGHQIVYVSEAEVIHAHNETWQGVYNRYRREGMAFKKIYPEAHFNLADFSRLFTVNVIHDMQEMRKQNRNVRTLNEILQFRRAQFWGTYQGYKQASRPLTMQLKQTFYYPTGKSLSGKANHRNVEPIFYPETSGLEKPGSVE